MNVCFNFSDHLDFNELYISYSYIYNTYSLLQETKLCPSFNSLFSFMALGIRSLVPSAGQSLAWYFSGMHKKAPNRNGRQCCYACQ